MHIGTGKGAKADGVGTCPGCHFFSFLFFFFLGGCQTFNNNNNNKQTNKQTNKQANKSILEWEKYTNHFAVLGTGLKS